MLQCCPPLHSCWPSLVIVVLATLSSCLTIVVLSSLYTPAEPEVWDWSSLQAPLYGDWGGCFLSFIASLAHVDSILTLLLPLLFSPSSLPLLISSFPSFPLPPLPSPLPPPPSPLPLPFFPKSHCRILTLVTSWMTVNEQRSCASCPTQKVQSNYTYTEENLPEKIVTCRGRGWFSMFSPRSRLVQHVFSYNLRLVGVMNG